MALLLNPRLLDAEKKLLLQIYEAHKKPEHVFLASSGSSQQPGQSLKLIALSHQALAAAADSVNRYLQSTSSDRWFNVLPEFHVGGLAISYRAKASGATLIKPDHWMWDASEFCQQVDALKITLTSLVPTQIFDLVRLGLQAPDGLRAVLVGGGALSDELYHQGRKLGWPLLPGYGFTEASALIAGAPLASLLTQAFPEFAVLDHVEVRTTPEGILEVRAPSLLSGWGQVRDGQVHWQDFASEWWQTSDYVQLSQRDEKFFLKPLGRDSDFVKINGEGVNLANLRAILAKVAGAQQKHMTLLAVAEERSGHKLQMLCEKQIFPNEAARILANFNSQVLPFERIKDIFFVEEISRTALGKIEFAKLKIRT